MSQSGKMTVSVARCDDRLIHGQIIYKWLKHLNLTHILIVSDSVSQSIDKQRLILLSTPRGINTKFIRINDFLTTSEKYVLENYLILFEDLKTCWKVVNLGVAIDCLFIGRVPSAVGRHKVANNVYLNLDEVNMLAEITKHGVTTIIQDVPDREALDVSEKIEDFKKMIE